MEDTSRATGTNDHVLQRLTIIRTTTKENFINADIHRRIGKIKIISLFSFLAISEKEALCW